MPTLQDIARAMGARGPHVLNDHGTKSIPKLEAVTGMTEIFSGRVFGNPDSVRNLQKEDLPVPTEPVDIDAIEAVLNDLPPADRQRLLGRFASEHRT